MNTQTIFGAAALTVAIAGCGSGAVHHSPPPPMASSCEYAASVDGSTVVIRWHNSAQKMSCHAELAAVVSTGMQDWHATAMPTNNRPACEVNIHPLAPWRIVDWQGGSGLRSLAVDGP
jgi:hypothetical protein